jgi:hypothetical protein
MYILALYYPDADAFHPAGIYITCVLYGHLCISGVQTAHMFMIESLFAADKYFPERPFGL